VRAAAFSLAAPSWCQAIGRWQAQGRQARPRHGAHLPVSAGQQGARSASSQDAEAQRHDRGPANRPAGDEDDRAGNIGDAQQHGRTSTSHAPSPVTARKSGMWSRCPAVVSARSRNVCDITSVTPPAKSSASRNRRSSRHSPAGRPLRRRDASWPPTGSASPHRTPAPAAPLRGPRTRRRGQLRRTSRTGSAPLLTRRRLPCGMSIPQPARSPASRHQGCSACVSPFRGTRREYPGPPKRPQRAAARAGAPSRRGGCRCRRPGGRGA
jgi:hypothetical protein